MEGGTAKGMPTRKEGNLTQRARELRKCATPQEQKLWYQFLRRYPVKFRRQQQIGPYIADFYCPAVKLVVELDGGGHYRADGIEYDRWRDAYMRGNGLQILRFTNTQIEKEFDSVCAEISRVVPSQSAALTAPYPLCPLGISP